LEIEDLRGFQNLAGLGLITDHYSLSPRLAVFIWCGQANNRMNPIYPEDPLGLGAVAEADQLRSTRFWILDFGPFDFAQSLS
jgi:hypothetical protein